MSVEEIKKIIIDGCGHHYSVTFYLNEGLENVVSKISEKSKVDKNFIRKLITDRQHDGASGKGCLFDTDIIEIAKLIINAQTNKP